MLDDFNHPPRRLPWKMTRPSHKVCEITVTKMSVLQVSSCVFLDKTPRSYARCFWKNLFYQNLNERQNLGWWSHFIDRISWNSLLIRQMVLWSCPVCLFLCVAWSCHWPIMHWARKKMFLKFLKYLVFFLTWHWAFKSKSRFILKIDFLKTCKHFVSGFFLLWIFTASKCVYASCFITPVYPVTPRRMRCDCFMSQSLRAKVITTGKTRHGKHSCSPSYHNSSEYDQGHNP